MTPPTSRLLATVLAGGGLLVAGALRPAPALGLAGLIVLASIMFVHRRLAFVLLVGAVVIGANLPPVVAHRLQINTEILLYVLIVVTTLTLLARFFNALSTGLEPEPGARGGYGVKALQQAAARGRLSLVRALVEEGVDVDGADETGRTVLMHAVAGGHVEVVRALLAAGARPDRIDHHGMSALDLALQTDHPELAPLLAADWTRTGRGVAI